MKLTTVRLFVDDVEGCARFYREAFGFVTEPHDRPEWVMRVAHLRDPEGNLIELYESTYPGGGS